MQRYFVQKKHVSPPFITITGDDVKHIQKVMRMTPGDDVVCADNQGSVYLCKINTLTTDDIQVEIVKELPTHQELPIYITIVQGLPKGDKLEWIVQKGTECGAGTFLPYEAERSIVKWPAEKVEKKLNRLRKIAKEAAEQSHRAYVPMVEPPLSLNQLIETSTAFKHKIVAYEETAKNGEQMGLPNVFKKMKQGEGLLVVIGPEGGFSSSEIGRFESAGFTFCGLGNRILRTETAPLFVLSAASYHFELLNGVR